MSLNKLFTEHPRSVGETYFQHLGNASSFAVKMIGGGIACFIHALLPFLFVKAASHTIQDLNERMVLHRSKIPPLSNAGSRIR